MKNIINHFEYLKSILELAKQRKNRSIIKTPD